MIIYVLYYKTIISKFYFFVSFFIFFFSIACAKANSVGFNLSSGYEHLNGLSPSQANNLFLQAGLSKEFLLSRRNYFGFEFLTRTGFSGPFMVSDEIQDSIGGPTPIISSTPRIALSGFFKNYLGTSTIYLKTQLGFDFGYLKFDRCDLAGQPSISLLGNIGLGFNMSKKSSIYLMGGKSYSLSQLKFDNTYLVRPPYSDLVIQLGFTKIF